MTPFLSAYRRGVAARLILYILLFSSVVTCLGTSLQLYLDYSRDVQSIRHRMNQVESSHLQSIVTSLWVSNMNLLRIQLDGIMQLPDMEYVTIEKDGEPVIQLGTPQEGPHISRSFPLHYVYRGKEINLGYLHADASLEGVYDRLFDRVLVILPTQAVKTFVVSIFIFILFHYLVGRHLQTMAAYARNLRLEDPGDPLALPRAPSGKDGMDELDQLTLAINDMRVNLHDSYDSLNTTNERLHQEISHRDQAERALQKSEQQLRAILDNATAVIYVKDVEGRFLLVNRMFENIFHLTQKDIIGKSVLELLDRQTAEQHLENDRQVLETLRPAQFDETARQEDGVHHFLSIKFPLLDASGMPFAVGGISTDITDRKQAEEELHTAKQAAESASKSKSEFLANMSHEIRTPLNGILGILQLLQGSRLSNEQKTYVGMALQSGKGLLDIISDILDLSRVEAGKLEFLEEELDLPETLSGSVDMFQPQIDEKGLTFNLDIDRDIPSLLLGDNGRVRQVIFNLLGNAVKFTDNGKVSLRATMAETQPDTSHVRVLFTVSDTGIGLAQDKMETIFEPFTQADGSYAKRHSGAGLGLSIVKRLVDLMGGSVKIESREGMGTTVRFTLDFKRVADLVGESRGKELDVAPAFKSGLRILLAEDDVTNQFISKRLLEKQGQLVTCASDGQEALEALARERFDCILMDIQMPGMDGIEATQAIRGGKSGINAQDIPIIALTAYAMKGDKEKFLKAGMTDHLPKPVDMEELKKILGKVIGK